MLISKALLSSWGWLSAQASHLGFSPLTELTYPLVTQGTITDGQLWTFSAYQLNTVDLSSNDPGGKIVIVSFEDLSKPNVLDCGGCNNVLWMSDVDMKLYESVDNGAVTGFNPRVLTPLIKMYFSKPRAREHSLTPYLSPDKTVSNYHEPYQRNKLHMNHRHMYSNR